MVGDLSPWFSMVLGGVLVVLVLLISLSLLLRMIHTRPMMTRMYCPWVCREVTVRHLTDHMGDPIAVISCTAFADTTIVLCERQCLRGMAETA